MRTLYGSGLVARVKNYVSYNVMQVVPAKMGLVDYQDPEFTGSHLGH